MWTLKLPPAGRLAASQVSDPAAMAHEAPAAFGPITAPAVQLRPASVGSTSATWTPVAAPVAGVGDGDGEADVVARADGVVIGDLVDVDVGAVDGRRGLGLCRQPSLPAVTEALLG